MFGIRNNIVASVMLHALMFAAAFIAGSSSELRNRSMVSVSLVVAWNTEPEGLTKETSGQQQQPSNMRHTVAAHKEILTRNLSRVMTSTPVNAAPDSEALSVPSLLSDNIALPSSGLYPDGDGSSSAVSSVPYAGAGTASVSSGNTAGSVVATSGVGGAGRQQGSSGDASLRQMIRDALQANLVYPYIARKRQMEGSVMVSFRINQTGKPEAITILKGSGYSILDSAARETVVKASPFPAINNFIEVPITFTLKDH
jgi:protein TonB